MKTPRYTDHRIGRYRTSEDSREPGYLAKRMKAYSRLQRMRDARPNVTQLRKKAA